MHEQRQRSQPARYAVEFREGDGPSTAGPLLIDEQGILLQGRRNGQPVELCIPGVELARVRIAQSSSERLNGYATVVLERGSGPPVLVAPFGIALVHELADLLAGLGGPGPDAEERLQLLVPLRPGCRQRARELLAHGPPFDPVALGLRSHQVYLTDRHALFVFQGPNIRPLLARALSEPGLWRAGLAWRSCIAARPQLATGNPPVSDGHELIYSWGQDQARGRG